MKMNVERKLNGGRRGGGSEEKRTRVEEKEKKKKILRQALFILIQVLPGIYFRRKFSF